MSKDLSFIVYCLEEYKNDKKLTGKDVVDLFNKYNVFDYIKTFYEALHVTGNKHIINDIDLYIKSRETIQ